MTANTAHTTQTSDRPDETPWPIDPIGPGSPVQRVLVEAEVFDDGAEDGFVTLSIRTGNRDLDDGCELISVFDAAVRGTVHRIPDQPAQPTMVPAHRLKGFEVHVFGQWQLVAAVDDSPLPGIVELDLAGTGVNSIAVASNALIPARLPEVAR